MNPQHPASDTRWHNKREPCPACGDQPIHNEALVAAQLNSHLYQQVERQHNETKFARKARTERPPV